MRLIIPTLVLVLGACDSDQPQRQASQTPHAPSATIATPTAAVAGQSAPLMAIPDDAQALKRLEAMGYTIHQEEGHLHAPGLTSCPAMGDGPTM